MVIMNIEEYLNIEWNSKLNFLLDHNLSHEYLMNKFMVESFFINILTKTFMEMKSFPKRKYLLLFHGLLFIAFVGTILVLNIIERRTPDSKSWTWIWKDNFINSFINLQWDHIMKINVD